MLHEKLDQIDQANIIADAYNTSAVAAISALVPDEREEPEEDMECVLCGTTLPAKRYALGHDICVGCSEYAEKTNKRYRKSSWEDS